MIPQRPSRTLMIWAVLACDAAIMVSKFVVGYAAGSSSLLSEAAHTTVDVSIGLLLLHGERRAALPRDESHPFGHGREIYFWSFVVSLLMFSGGAVVAVYTGVLAILNPEPLGDLRAAYLVLAISGLFEAGSLWIAWRRVLKLVERRRETAKVVPGGGSGVGHHRRPTGHPVWRHDHDTAQTAGRQSGQLGTKPGQRRAGGPRVGGKQRGAVRNEQRRQCRGGHQRSLGLGLDLTLGVAESKINRLISNNLSLIQEQSTQG